MAIQKLCSTCSSKSPSVLHYVFVLSLRLAVNQLSFLRIAHEGALRSGGEGDHEPEDARGGQPAGCADRLGTSSLRGHARRRSRECLAAASPRRGLPPCGFPDFQGISSWRSCRLHMGGLALQRLNALGFVVVRGAVRKELEMDGSLGR